VVRQFNVEYLEARKAGLNAYIGELCRRRDVLNCKEAQIFFGLPEHAAGFKHPDAAEPVQVAEVHEAAFGITDADYDPMQGLLLLGSSDCSWTSRIDTKITNIKLPWEPAAPNLPSSQMSLWRQSPSELRFDLQFTCRYTAAISCVRLAILRDKELCLCGLSDGTVGCHSLKGHTGVSNASSTLPLLRHTAAVKALAIDEAEQWIISASKDNALMVYDARRQMILCEAQTPAATSVLYYCQSQKRLFTGLQNGTVVFWDLTVLPMRQMGRVPDGPEAAPASKISALDYNSATSTLFTASKEGLALWSVKASSTGCWARRVGAVANVASQPCGLAWANSSREIIAGLATGAVAVYDVDQGDASYAIQAHSDEVSTIIWLDAPRRLLTASKDKTLKIWDFPSLRRTPLEDASLLAAPTVSMAPHMIPRGGQQEPLNSGGHSGVAAGGGDPLLGRGGGDAAPVAGGSFNPLARGRTSSATSEPRESAAARAVAAYAASDSISGPVPPPAQASRTVPAAAGTASAYTAAQQPRPPSGALARDDSDDDLVGWDT
jgi:WD40 repeat protein